MKFSDIIEKLPRITEAVFHKGTFDTSDMQMLADALKYNATIGKLEFSKSCLIEEESFKILANVFKTNSTIKTLFIRSKAGPEATAAFLEILKENHTLTSLTLACNKFNLKTTQALIDLFKINKSIHSLTLHGNQIDAEQAHLLTEPLRSNTSIISLSLQYNDQLGSEGIKAIAAGLKNNHSMTQLNLEYCNVGPEGAQSIAEIIKIDKQIQKLNLSSNEISDEGACAIAEALKNNTAMTEIDLSGNRILTKGAIAVAEMLKINSSIEILSLDDNKIGEEGAIALGEALEVNATLMTLSLCLTYVHDKGAEAFAKSLKKNTSMVQLKLQQNYITEMGGKYFAEALRGNRTLTDLDLEGGSNSTIFAGGNNIGSIARNEIENLLNRNNNRNPLTNTVLFSHASSSSSAQSSKISATNTPVSEESSLISNNYELISQAIASNDTQAVQTVDGLLNLVALVLPQIFRELMTPFPAQKEKPPLLISGLLTANLALFKTILKSCSDPTMNERYPGFLAQQLKQEILDNDDTALRIIDKAALLGAPFVQAIINSCDIDNALIDQLLFPSDEIATSPFIAALSHQKISSIQYLFEYCSKTNRHEKLKESLNDFKNKDDHSFLDLVSIHLTNNALPHSYNDSLRQLLTSCGIMPSESGSKSKKAACS